MQALMHNMTAQFTERQLGITGKEKGKSSERLSSGYRINRSADDGAGLQISEKMRWQIRGLDKASDNCKTGGSFLQVADGAMQELEDIIQRMRELSVQGANDTNTPADRAAIKSELDALSEEVERITTTTEFNTIGVFTWELTKVNYVRDGAAGWVSQEGGETIRVTGNGYGLGLLLGNNVYNGTKLDSRLTLSGGGWTSTGYLKYNGKDAAAAAAEIGAKTGIPDTTILAAMKQSSSVPGNGFVVNDVSSGYRLTFSYDSRKKTLDGSYPATSIKLEHGTYGNPLDLSSFVPDPGSVETTYLNSEGVNGVMGLDDGRAYPSVWLDFCGLGTDYALEDLYGMGFNTTCTICGRANANITFTGETCSLNNADGVNYDYSPNANDQRLTINISGCTSGADIVKRIISAVSSCSDGVTDPDPHSYMDQHFTQYAVNRSNPSRLYIYDNHHSGYNGGDSTFEMVPRNKEGEMVLGDVVITKDGGMTRMEYRTRQLWIQAGAKNQSGMFIDRPLVNSTILGVSALGVSDYHSASISIAACDAALRILNSERAKAGAQQNRLEYARAIDDNTSENTQSAESKLRDADMAEEMVSFSKHKILQQAGESMLTQANQTQESILRLLQG